MTGKKSKALPYEGITGIIHTTIHMPEDLHETMKVIRRVRHQREGSQVRLCRIYREAVELYINSEPQQLLLKESADGTKRRRARVAAGM